MFSLWTLFGQLYSTLTLVFLYLLTVSLSHDNAFCHQTFKLNVFYRNSSVSDFYIYQIFRSRIIINYRCAIEIFDKQRNQESLLFFLTFSILLDQIHTRYGIKNVDNISVCWMHDATLCTLIVLASLLKGKFVYVCESFPFFLNISNEIVFDSHLAAW